MKSHNQKQQRSESSAESEPDPEFIAKQLRRPSGDFASDIGKKMNQVNEPLFDLVLDIMQPEDNNVILEIGFGTGKFFNRLFDRANGLQVSGIDFSEAMVVAAEEHNPETISSGRLNLKRSSSNAIPFADQTFDKVFCNMVVYFWNQPGPHLKEIRRVLKPGGTFLTGIRTRESMLVFPFVEYGFNLYSTEEWKEILDQSGFTVKETHKRSDPELDFKGNKLRLESCCIVADKAGEVS